MPATAEIGCGPWPGDGVSCNESCPAAAGLGRHAVEPFRMARMRIPLMASPRSRLAQLAVALIVVLVPSRLSAQAPDERADLERFRDSLAATSDTAGLLVLERRMIDLAKADRSNALVHLKLGFLSLRLGELGGQAHYDDAASEFQWAIDLQPTWPYAWYGMGLAEYGVGDSQISFVTGLKTMLGKDALTRSAMAFAKSAEVDPAFVRGLVELSNTALRQRVNIKLGVALDALRRAASPSSETPRCCSPADGSSARWATATPRWPPSAATSTAASTGASASSRSRARCSCSAASTACSPTTRARRPTTRRPSRATAPTSPRSPRTAS